MRGGGGARSVREWAGAFDCRLPPFPTYSIQTRSEYLPRLWVGELRMTAYRSELKEVGWEAGGGEGRCIVRLAVWRSRRA